VGGSQFGNVLGASWDFHFTSANLVSGFLFLRLRAVFGVPRGLFLKMRQKIDGCLLVA
jgi:hypothetical protein